MTFNVGDIVAEGTEDETLEPTYFLIVDEWETTFHMLTLNTNSLFIRGGSTDRANMYPKSYIHKWCKKVS